MREQNLVEWGRHPQATAYVNTKLDQLVDAMPPVLLFREQLVARTSTRLADWIDHLVLADDDAVRRQLVDLGFEAQEVPAEPGDTVYHHPGALVPRLILRADQSAEAGAVLAAAIAVEDIVGFLVSQRLVAPVEGAAMAPYRRALAWQVGRRQFHVVERRWERGFVPFDSEPGQAETYLQAHERWATRQRQFDDPRAGMEHTLRLARALVDEFGVGMAAWAALQAEQECWQQRSWAGQVQKARQDSLGLGWANRDHMAFRSSRETFELLIQILETLGFEPRERFYAGAEAGWGAQVLEQPACRVAVFADVDLAPEESEGDFAHRPLPPRSELGTIGLWCGLHGESMLEAGTHHLACRLDFQAASADLARWEIGWMRPFSDFPYLKQAFTRGERWEVPGARLGQLEQRALIDAQQRAQFSTKGAVGSHLENIQRDEGFKGFNQLTVSDIIRRTDPRAAGNAAPDPVGSA